MRLPGEDSAAFPGLPCQGCGLLWVASTRTGCLHHRASDMPWREGHPGGRPHTSFACCEAVGLSALVTVCIRCKLLNQFLQLPASLSPSHTPRSVPSFSLASLEGQVESSLQKCFPGLPLQMQPRAHTRESDRFPPTFAPAARLDFLSAAVSHVVISRPGRPQQQQQQHHLRTGQKCKFSGPTPNQPPSE